jgi:hypothetical protein
MLLRLKLYQVGVNETGLVGRVVLVIEHDRGEVTIDIHPAPPSAGDTQPELAIRRELVTLREAIDHILVVRVTRTEGTVSSA